jgi:hypothetical protein
MMAAVHQVDDLLTVEEDDRLMRQEDHFMDELTLAGG